jgi:dTDP-4-dehydrorhamnose 3,5-epimerase
MKFFVEKIKSIDGAILLIPNTYTDERGQIWTTFNDEVEKLTGISFKHDKFSISAGNVLRGIHGDKFTTKLVTCIMGGVKQVVVDLRPQSRTFGNHFIVEINREKPALVLIPAGCGNAFYTTQNDTVYHYKLSYPNEYLDFDEQFTIMWDDKDLGIGWDLNCSPILSPRDAKGKSFASYKR